MQLPYRKPLTGLIAGFFWDDATKFARIAYDVSVLGIRSAVAEIDREAELELKGHDAESLHCHREQIDLHAASYLRAVQFCLLFGRFEWAIGLLCDDVQQILGREKLPALNVKSYASERLSWLRKAVPTLSPQSFESELDGLSELRNAIMHDGGRVALEFKKERFEHISAFITKHPGLAQIESQELMFSEAMMGFSEKWFRDGFSGLHEQTIQALNGMSWAIEERPSHEEMATNLATLISEKRKQRERMRSPEAVKCSEGNSTPQPK